MAPGGRHRIAAALIVLVAGSLAVAGAARRHAIIAPTPRHSVAAKSRPAGTVSTHHERRATTTASSTTTAAADPAALAVADSFVTAYAGYDWHHPSGDAAAWQALVTPALYTRLTGPAGSTTGMTALQVARHESAAPAVRSTTWESGGPQTATVLVDCVLSVTSDAGAPRQLDTPYPLTLTRASGAWRVSAVSAGG